MTPCLCLHSWPSQGLLPPAFRQLSANQVPVFSTVVTGVITTLVALLISLKALADAISVGTLFAFSIVDAGVIVLRYVHLCLAIPYTTSYPPCVAVSGTRSSLAWPCP